MSTYVINRLLNAVFVAFGVVTLVFFVLRILPGDPAYVLAGPTATQAEVDELRRALGLDQPAYVQYGIFLRQLAQGDLGNATYFQNESALGLVLERMPATLELVIPSLLIAVFLALVLGAISALRNGTW